MVEGFHHRHRNIGIDSQATHKEVENGFPTLNMHA